MWQPTCLIAGCHFWGTAAGGSPVAALRQGQQCLQLPMTDGLQQVFGSEDGTSLAMTVGHGQQHLYSSLVASQLEAVCKSVRLI